MGKGNESGPAPKAGTLREDMGRSPTGRAGTVIGMGIYGPRLQGGTYIGKKIWALANSERHIRNGDGMGLDGSRNQSGTAYGPPPPKGRGDARAPRSGAAYNRKRKAPVFPT